MGFSEENMANIDPKQRIYANLAEIAQSISHPSRLELLEYLAQGKRSVEELATLCGIEFANASRHLQTLRRARLVETERKGKHVYYSIVNQDSVIELLNALGIVGKQNNAEIKQIMADYFEARDKLTPISREDLLAHLTDGNVTLLDVRPEHEFNQGHLPGALNISIEKLAEQLSQLPKGMEIVAYCRGPYCLLSLDAIELLTAQGFKIRRLEEGFPEWKAAGLQIENA